MTTDVDRAARVSFYITLEQAERISELARTLNRPADQVARECFENGLEPYETPPPPALSTSSLAEKYPQYHKNVSKLATIDVYAVLGLFEIHEHTIGHAIKKLLLAGTRTGGKVKAQDVKEARDTLNRWFELQENE